MAIKKKRRVSIRIDMTPMVDIAFLLLIFYMATTQFKPPEARAVELPESHSMIELPDKDLINVTVTKYDSIYVDIVQKIKMRIDGKLVETTARVVRVVDRWTVAGEINRARDPNQGGNPRALVVIKADRDASFGIMQALMETMQENYLTRFLIITDDELDEEA